MDLDERWREKLRHAAEREERERESLSEAARARVIANVLRDAELQARRRRLTRVLGGSVVVAVGMAAAFTLFVREPRAPHRGDAPIVAEAPAPRAAECASDATASTALSPLAAGQRVELDRRARFATTEASVAAYRSASSCEATVELASGTVDVWARALRGGELSVAAGDVRVIVHGTVFRVTRGTSDVRVSVDEGRVEVRAPGVLGLFVGAGESVRLVRSEGETTEWTFVRTTFDAGDRSSLHALTEDERAESAALPTRQAPRATASQGPATAVAPGLETDETGAESIDAILLQAEHAYREGRVEEARRLFRVAGSTHGADAEAAWLRLGRLELRAGHPNEAVAALAEHRSRFPRGRLSAEALFLEASAQRERGDEAAARSLEDRLLRENPSSPQARRVREARGE